MKSLPDPNGCRWCGISQRDHMQRWKAPVGWHTWEQPTQQQTKDRMVARSAQRPGKPPPDPRHAEPGPAPRPWSRPMTDQTIPEQKLADIEAIAARVADDPFYVSDCEGSLQVWREAALTHVRRDEAGEIEMYSFPSSYKVTDQVIEIDLGTWDPGEDETDDKQRQDICDLVESRAAVPLLLAEIRRLRYRVAELGEQGPGDLETVAEAAQMYRSLRPVIERTMTDPDRWDGDEDESFHLGRYVEWLAAERAQVRAEELNKAADEMDAHCEQHGVLGVGDRLRRMATAPAVAATGE